MNKIPAIFFACGLTALIITLGLDIKTKSSARTNEFCVTVFSAQGTPANHTKVELLTASKKQISQRTTNTEGQACFDSKAIQNHEWNYLKITAPNNPLQAPLIIHRNQIQWPFEAHLPAL